MIRVSFAEKVPGKQDLNEVRELDRGQKGIPGEGPKLRIKLVLQWHEQARSVVETKSERYKAELPMSCM